MDISDPTDLPPFLIDNIATSLSHRDLTQCCLVSKTWSNEFGERLWKAISIHRENAFQHFDSSDAIICNALIRHAAVVRSLSLRYSNWTVKMLALFAKVCTGITSIEIFCSETAFIKQRPYFPAREDSISGNFALELCQNLDVLLARNPRVRSIRIYGMLHPSHFVRCLTRDDIQLSRLDLNTHGMQYPLNPIELKKLLDKISGSILELSLNATLVDITDLDGGGIDETGHSEPPTQHEQRYYPLRKLTIRGGNKEANEYVWSQFLTRCSSLQKLTLGWYGNTNSLPFLNLGWLSSAIETFSLSMQELDLASTLWLDEHYAQVINACSGLRGIVIPGGEYFGHLAVAALQRHAPSLERVRILGCKRVTSKVTQFLLTRAPHMREFISTIDQESQYRRSTRLKLSINSSLEPWTCLNLSILKLVIGGIPRPDLEDEDYGSLLEKQHGIDLERRVCAQLGALVNLEELWLGHYYLIYGPIEESDSDDDDEDGDNYGGNQDEDANFEEDEGWNDDEDDAEDEYVWGEEEYVPPVSGYQKDCLQLSLSTGLDLMSNMKAMRILNISSMAHRVRLAEVQWMCSQWPRLQIIEGLFDTTPSISSSAELS
ncbi:hypothetical protein BGZ46_005007, partial [Entomortierella lignicola]